MTMIVFHSTCYHRHCARRAAFKGQPDGEAVLCTSSATFAVKTVETTNSMLLLPDNACIIDDDKVCMKK